MKSNLSDHRQEVMWRMEHTATMSGHQRPEKTSRGSGSKRIDLRTLSRRNLGSLQLFMLISCVAFIFRDIDLYMTLPESVLQILGAPPPVTLAHLAFSGYIFTVLTPLIIHLLNGERPVAHWRHLGFRSAFYLFYFCTGTLAINFIVVFVISLVLYLLEQTVIGAAIARDGRTCDNPA